VQRTHPIDRTYGIDTSGSVSVENLHPDPRLQCLIVDYLASQPSIVRRGLSALGNIRDYVFVDLGCGKGRATTVAGEFPFRAVVGVELSAALAATARANAATIARHRRRKRVEQASWLRKRLLGPELRCVLAANDSDKADFRNASKHLGCSIRTARMIAEVFGEQFFVPVRSLEARLDRYLRN
jgi:SAM-dependent methyltransferase